MKLPTKACLSLAFALLVPAARAALATACWRILNSQVVSFEGVPCGIVTSDSPVVPCCNMDSYCLSDSICLTPGVPNPGFTGYYTAGCTDLSYISSACNPYCRDLYRVDIVYNNISQVWSCCGTESDNNTVNCDSPTKEIFDDPAPSGLSTTFSVGTIAVTAPATILSSTSTPVQSTSSTSSAATAFSGSPSQTAASQPSTGLSTGAKAGIGIGAALGGIVVLLGGMLLLRRRQANRPSPGNGYKLNVPPPQELGVVRKQEQKRAELFSGSRIHELS